MSDLILPILKVLGVLLTAFFSLMEILRPKAPDGPDLEAKKRRWSITGIVCSVALAVIAEAWDVYTKRREATIAANRAADAAAKTLRIINDLDRSLHPIYPIKVRASFVADLSAAPFAPYRERLLNALPEDEEQPQPPLVPGGALFPRPDEHPAFALLTADPQMTIFLYRRARSAAPLDSDQAPDLSFWLPRSRTSTVDGSESDPRLVDDTSRTFGYKRPGLVSIMLPTATISAAEAYSNGKIVSSSDLPGSTLVVRVSPFFVMRSPTDSVHTFLNALDLEGIDLELPGSRELQIRAPRFRKSRVTDELHYTFQFPATKAELEKLYVP